MNEKRPRQYAAEIIQEAKEAHERARVERDEAARQAILDASRARRQRMLNAAPAHLRGSIQEIVESSWERDKFITRRR